MDRPSELFYKTDHQMFFFFLFVFLWAGARRGRICTGSRSDIQEKIFLKLILCQNVFCKRSTHAMYLKTKIDQNLFSYVTLYFATQMADLIPFLFWYCSSTRLCYYSAFTLWRCVLILKEPLYCRGCISVCIPSPVVVLYCPLLSANHPLAY